MRSWQRAYSGILDPAFLSGLSVERYAEGWTQLLSSVPTPHVGVATDMGGRLLGFSHVCPSRDGDAVPGTGELTSLYLEPGSWGTGVGSELHDTAMVALGGAHTQATLWVLEANERARWFYERKGWVLDGPSRVEDVGSPRCATGACSRRPENNGTSPRTLVGRRWPPVHAARCARQPRRRRRGPPG